MNLYRRVDEVMTEGVAPENDRGTATPPGGFVPALVSRRLHPAGRAGTITEHTA